MKKLRIEGIICLIVALTYSGLAFYSLVTWQQVSEGLVVGFALFAQSLLRRFFDDDRTPHDVPNPGTNVPTTKDNP